MARKYPRSQLAGNMTGHLALIRGNESHIGGYNLIFLVLFLWYELWSLLVSGGRAQGILQAEITKKHSWTWGWPYILLDSNWMQLCHLHFPRVKWGLHKTYDKTGLHKNANKSITILLELIPNASNKVIAKSFANGPGGIKSILLRVNILLFLGGLI